MSIINTYKPAKLPRQGHSPRNEIKIDLAVEIAVAIFIDAVIATKTTILRILDEREKTGAPPLLSLVYPDGEIEKLVAPNAYVRLTDDAMEIAGAGVEHLGDEPIPECVARADQTHFAAHLEIIERTEAMLRNTPKRAFGYVMTMAGEARLTEIDGRSRRIH
jgi:hypothetical protein